MIVFHSHCQMANQMFMYAAAKTLAKKKGFNYCLSDLSELKYFRLSICDRNFNGIKYLWYRLSNKFLRKYSYHHCQDNFEDYTEVLKISNKNSWFYGYFQGLNYFVGYEDSVKQGFEIKTKFKKYYNQFYKEIDKSKKVVAVHVRRKDYKDFNLTEIDGPDLCLPNSYYRKTLIPYIGNDDFQIVFLSDEIEAVENEYGGIDNAIFSKNEAIVDFQILMHADVLILANSSFSWWGAWLNKKENKLVFTPKYFLGFKVKKEYPVNIIPETWQQIEVYE